MDAILLGYDVNAATWFYLSSLLIVAVYFRFNRVWSLRNLDLCLLLGLSPGLLLVRAAGPQSSVGYVWLFVATAVLLMRLWGDGLFTRRPRLEQNLNRAGLTFLCIAAVVFHATKILTERPHHTAVATVQEAGELIHMQDSGGTKPVVPTAGLSGRLLAAPVLPLAGGVNDVAARALAITAHVAILLGLYFVGRWHFGDGGIGWAMATLYLLLPCTAYDVSRVPHVLPAALLVWAVACSQRPMMSGIWLGLACGTTFFTVFLVPIWVSYYWQRGAVRFVAAMASVAVVLIGSLLLTSADSASFTRQIVGSIDWSVLKFEAGEGLGFWSLYDTAYRVPVFASYLVLLVMLTMWPAGKNLEHLLAQTASAIVATQFWYPNEGGVYLLWYVPLVLMVIFRPKLHLSQRGTVQATVGRNGMIDRPETIAVSYASTSTRWRSSLS
jgi:hypothetical protein